MLDKFNREHWHDEDEVRFVIQGRGLFHIRPKDGPVVKKVPSACKRAIRTLANRVFIA